MIQIGEKLPSAQLFKVGEKGIDELDSLEYVSNKKVVLVAVPGAFTPHVLSNKCPVSWITPTKYYLRTLMR